MYVTYDLQQASNSEEEGSNLFVHSAEEVNFPGPVLQWEVGEFPEETGGRHVFGVRVEYADPVMGPLFQTIAVPDTARNVQLRESELPPEYQQALRRAA